MNIQPLFEFHTARGDSVPFSGTDVAQHVRSPFALWCKYFAPPEEKDPPARFQQMLIESGKTHESVQIKERFPKAVKQPFVSLEQGFLTTLAMMNRGDSEIRGMPLVSYPNGQYGVPDVLYRQEGRSLFGDYQYGVVEIKLAWNLKPDQFIQAAYYTLLLGHIQRTTPTVFQLIAGDGELTTCKYLEFDQALQEALIGARSIVSGQSEPPPCFGHSSRPWHRFGNKLAIERNDVSLIAGVGPTLQNEMHRAGFPTLDDVANSSIADLTTVRGIGPANGFRFRSKAQALTTGKPVRLGASFELPTNQIELFLDLEGDDVGPEPVSYLFGVAERVNSDVKYYPFLAKQPTEEGKQFRRFLTDISQMESSAFINTPS